MNNRYSLASSSSVVTGREGSSTPSRAGGSMTQPSSSSALSPEDVAAFQQKGFLRVSGVFSEATARRCREEVWLELENRKNVTRDTSTWAHKKVGLDKVFTSEDAEVWSEVLRCGRLTSVLNDLLGEGRYDRPSGCGWWMVTFPPIQLPWCEMKSEEWEVEGRWHIDGWHHHYLFSKEIGIVLIMFFSDVEPKGGGTALAVGSHRIAAQILAEAGLRGMSSGLLSEAVTQVAINEGLCVVEEATGQAGDIIMMHPLLLHARSKNLGEKGVNSVRFMCNPAVSLKDHMRFSPEHRNGDGDVSQRRSVLEESIYSAVVGGSEAAHCDSRHSLLRRITPEDCDKFRKRKRNEGDEDDDDDDYGDNDDESLGGDTNGGELDNHEIEKVMGFAGFSSSRDSYHT